MKELELRMYGLTPYNLSPIQKGIQFGHAVVEYSLDFNKSFLYSEWAKKHKTFIILDGGTTNNSLNEDGLYKGTLNNYKKELEDNGINISSFNEPDLGDQLTAVTFIVDERVFDRKKYPDYVIWLEENKKYHNTEIYNEWLNFIGGEKNEFLRNFLKNFNLAR